MNIFKSIFVGILVVLSNHFLISCQNKASMDKIVYHFGDSSVPPQYHRSYEIVATADSIHVTVDSYGTILAEKSYSISVEQFGNLVSIIEQGKYKNQKEKENDGCTGGTTQSISFSNKGEKLFSAYVYHCGGKHFGTLDGDLSNLVKEMKALIPNFSELTQ